MFTLLNPLVTLHHFYKIANKVGPKNIPKKTSVELTKFYASSSLHDVAKKH